MRTGVNLVHLPYPGAGPALTNLLGGQIQVGFPDMAGSIEYIRAAKLRALAVTTATRSEALPDIPTIGELLAGFEASQWVGLDAPRNTPSEMIDRLKGSMQASSISNCRRGSPTCAALCFPAHPPPSPSS
jgi:tripartite-type tricarboxylate transporter receptor subunit TctC